MSAMTETAYARLKRDWAKRRGTLTKGEVSALARKDTFAKRMKGFLTAAYWKREKLIASSEIVLGLVFKEWHGSPSETGNYFRDWVLFSPSVEINEKPETLLKVADALLKKENERPKDKSVLRFHDALFKPLADASYLQVPSGYAEGKLLYLSILERPFDLNDGFRLGIHPFLMNPSVSKEILFLPSEFWPEEDRKALSIGENPFMKGDKE